MEESLRPSGKMRVFRYILSLGSLFINVKNQQRKRKGDVEEQRSLENVVACQHLVCLGTWLGFSFRKLIFLFIYLYTNRNGYLVYTCRQTLLIQLLFILYESQWLPGVYM